MTSTPLLNIKATRLQADSAIPLYRQLYNILKKKIESGSIKKDECLPAEQEFITKLGVSRITIRRTLNELAASGYVKRQRGRGTIVTFNASAPHIKANFENLIDGLTRIGVETDVELLSCRTVKSNENLSQIMDITPGDRLKKIIRLRRLENEPFSYLVTHIPEKIASHFRAEELATGSLLNMLNQLGYNPVAAQQTIQAAAAEVEIATALGISIGAPIMKIHRTMRDKHGTVVQEITAHYRADRFQYQMDLVKRKKSHWTPKP